MARCRSRRAGRAPASARLGAVRELGCGPGGRASGRTQPWPGRAGPASGVLSALSILFEIYKVENLFTQARDRLMVDVDAALGRAGLRNIHVREYVRYWAELTGAARVEVVSASDDARLIGEGLADGEILPAGEGRYYSRSYVKDTARSEERTVVATSNPADKGVYNNWRPASEMRALLEERMRGASAGKTMYVIPYLMAPAGSPLERYAAGVQLTDCRSVRAQRTTSVTSSRSPTSGPSCTLARPTAATRCSARSRTGCGRRPTTAGRRAGSWPSSSCSSALPTS